MYPVIGPTELIMIIITLMLTIVWVLAFWKIFNKAGFPGWPSLLILVPIVQLFVPLFLALVEWPVHKQKEV